MELRKELLVASTCAAALLGTAACGSLDGASKNIPATHQRQELTTGVNAATLACEIDGRTFKVLMPTPGANANTQCTLDRAINTLTVTSTSPDSAAITSCDYDMLQHRDVLLPRPSDICG